MTHPQDRDDAAARHELPLTEEELDQLDTPLHELLAIDPEFASEDLAPPIDRNRILAFVRNKLSPDERDEIADMIASYRSWHEALRDLLRRGVP
jgi:hypothetical protein